MAPVPPKTNILLYTAGTPNGQKVSIVLEELGLNYEVHKIDISKNEQKQDWFLRINPNGRIPAIVDKTPDLKTGKATERRVFEGGAILQYLTAKYDPAYKISYAYDTDKYWEVIEWLTWMQSGLGPMQGQANHFYRYAPEKIPYAIQRYQSETKRLYGVLEARLKEQRAANRTAAGSKASTAGSTPESERRERSDLAEPGPEKKTGFEAGSARQPGTEGPWLVGDKCTIADLACFSWVNWDAWAGTTVTKEEFPELKEWLDRINERPAVQRGLDVPEKFEMKERMKSKEGEEEYQKSQAKWVMQGQEEQQKGK